MMSTHFAAFSTSSTLCISVVVAILSSSPTSFSIFNALSSPIPVNESNPQSELMAQKTIIEELEFSLLEMLAQEYWLIES